MTAIVMAQAKLKDAEKLKEYAGQAGATLEPFGGKFAMRLNKVEVAAGSYQPDFLVMLEFADVEKARGWYNSDAYQALIPTREQAADMTFVILEKV